MTRKSGRGPCAEARRTKTASAVLYLFLTAFVSLLIAAAAWGISSLLPPSSAPTVRGVLAAAACTWMVWIALEALSQRSRRPLIRAVPAALRRSLFGSFYPLCRLAGRVAGLSGDAVAAAYIAFSNGLSSGASGKCARGQLLVLLPRCLQREGCTRAIVEDVRTCARCGKCGMSELVPLMERYGFLMAVMTGGRLARAMVRDLKPAGVIAVACERELLEGLREGGRMPIICVTNLRPDGPCRNTSVDIQEFEAAVRQLMDKEGCEG